MKVYREWMYESNFTNLGGPGRFTPGERAPGTHCVGGWVDTRAGLDDVEQRKFLTLPGLELRPLVCPASSQSQKTL
jgi:hypothetical protein